VTTAAPSTSTGYDEKLMPEDGRSRCERESLALSVMRQELRRMDDVFVFGSRVLLIQGDELAGESNVEGLLNLGGRQ
jgi:hypothetical protein